MAKSAKDMLARTKMLVVLLAGVIIGGLTYFTVDKAISSEYVQTYVWQRMRPAKLNTSSTKFSTSKSSLNKTNLLEIEIPTGD